jgi:hypothetical protein
MFDMKKMKNALASSARVGFDYASFEISPEISAELEAKAKLLIDLGRKETDHIFELGALLEEASAHIPDGTFGKWVEARCNITARTARNWRGVHRNLGGYRDRAVALAIGPTVLIQLAHVERRAVRRLAVRNGLLTLSTAIVDGHVVSHFSPAFDLSYLTGDAEQDRRWVRDHLAGFLIEAPQDGNGRPVLVPALPGWPDHLRRHPANTKAAHTAAHAYAVRVVAGAGYNPSIKHMATLLLLSAALEQSGVTLRDLVAILQQSAPVFSVAVLADGFERALSQLIEDTGIVPYGPYTGVAADFAFTDDLWKWVDSETRRVFLQVPAGETSRPSRAALRGQLLRALADGTPVLAVSETHTGIPDQVDLTCDIRLRGAGIDRLLIADLLEAIYGSEAVMRHDSSIARIDAGVLTLDDLAIAIRPGRPILSSFDALAGLAALNREDKEDDRNGHKADASRRLITQSPSERREQTSRAGGNTGDRTSSTSTASSKGKAKSKSKPTGAEVIQPEPFDEASLPIAPPVMRVETLTGYGVAKDWALGLKADLADYLGGELAWSQMSTKLLLSGPPGTGKTTFARALCNTLQVQLVVTSVSTWLQGEYLHDVLDRMANTFSEARTQAPCILFIDEIDGIGQRASASRPYADYWNACVNKLLELLDGAVRTEGVIVVGATNRPDEIDEAIRRSGRLETHIEIPRPDIPTLAGILAHHLGSDLDAITAPDGQVGELTQVRLGKIIKDKYPELDDEDQEAVRQHAIAALNLTQQAKAALNPDGEAPKSGNTALLDGIRKIAMDVRELDIDLIDRINPFGEAYAILAKTMNEESLKQVAAVISGKNVKLTPEEARDLARRAVKFKQERGRLPSITAADAWERKLAEGVAYLARMKAEAANG